MSIRRTRQQKVNAAAGRKEMVIRYEPGEKSQAPAASTAALVQKNTKTESFFLLDMRKTAVSTLIILGLLAFAYWSMR